MKLCKYCLQEKEEHQFPSAGIVKGVSYRRRKCNTCYMVMKKGYKAQQRAGYFEYKKTLSCQKCGFSDYRALQFHHKSDKLFNVADGPQKMSLATIMKEIEKCEVLCANCHHIETFLTHVKH